MRSKLRNSVLFFFILGVLACQNPFPEKEIRTYDRNVMVEYFTATWCTNCENISENLAKLEEENADMVLVSYHPAGSDPLGTDVWQKKDSIYDIESVPMVIFDGVEKFIGGGVSYSEFMDSYEKEKEEKSPLKMNMTIVEDSLFLTVETDESYQGALHLLLLEDSLRSIGYDSIYNNVVRSETLFDVDLKIGENKFNLLIDKEKLINSSNGEVVAFFEEKGKILQAVKKTLE